MQSAVERQLEVAGDALGQVRKLDLDLFARVPEGALLSRFATCWDDAATNKVDELIRTIHVLLRELPEDPAA